MEYSGPVVLPAATVVARGDTVLVYAQNANLPPNTYISQVDYLYTNVGSVEMSSQFIGGSGTNVPAMPGWSVVLLAGALVLGAMVMQRRHARMTAEVPAK